MDDGFGCFVVVVVAVIAALIGGAVLIGNHLSRSACLQQAHALGFGAEYGMVKGCIYVKPDGTKVPRDAYREIVP